MKRLCVLVLALSMIGAYATPAGAHKLSWAKAQLATERLGNAAAQRISSRVAGADVIGRTNVGRCRAPHESRRHRHVIVCTWYLHVQYSVTDRNGSLIAGMPISQLTCLSDVTARIGTQAKQNNNTTTCRVRGQPTLPVNHRQPAQVGNQDVLPGYDLKKLERDIKRQPASRAKPLSFRRALEQRRRNALTHSVPEGVRIHLRGSKTLTPRDRRRAYLATEGAGRLAAAARGYVPTLKKRPTARASLFGNYDGQVAFASEQQDILNTIDYIYQVEINSIGGVYGFDGNVDLTYLTEGSIISNACGPDIMTYNMFYCNRDDSVTLDPRMSSEVFNYFGDGAFAGFVAHEFGHGAQLWLGWGFQGALWYTIYQEGLADCFAGAWYWSAYYYNYTDYGGFNGVYDSTEYVNGLNYLNAQSGGATTLDDGAHGDNNWRDSWVDYGWNNGFQGCAVQANNWNHGIT